MSDRLGIGVGTGHIKKNGERKTATDRMKAS